jgi:hypothetical protein
MRAMIGNQRVRLASGDQGEIEGTGLFRSIEGHALLGLGARPAGDAAAQPTRARAASPERGGTPPHRGERAHTDLIFGNPGFRKAVFGANEPLARVGRGAGEGGAPAEDFRVEGFERSRSRTASACGGRCDRHSFPGEMCRIRPALDQARAGASCEKGSGCEVRYVYRWHRMGRKGQTCRLIARGTMNSCLLEFDDGFTAITSRNAIMRARP